MSAPQVVTHSDLEVVEPWSFTDSKKPIGIPVPTYSQLHVQSEYPPQKPQHDYAQLYPPEKQERRTSSICGLPAKVFFIVLAAVIVALGIGVGIGLGAGMAIQNSKASTTSPATQTVTVTATTATATGATAAAAATAGSTSTLTLTPTSTPSLTSTSTTNFSPSTLIDAVIPTNGTVALNCPSIDATNLRITLGNTVSLFGVTCGQDVSGANQDILAIIAYSLSACAQACASYNRNLGQKKCVAATFNRNLTASVGPNYGTCWLKNGTASTIASNSNNFAGLTLQSTS